MQHITVSKNLPRAMLAASLFALTLSACATGSNFAPSGTTPATRTLSPRSAAGTPTPIPFKYATVDDPNSHVNQVTGINQRGKIVGWYGVGSASTIPVSYTSLPPYAKFKGENLPGAQGTVATSISSTHTIGGYVLDPNGLGGTWGFVQIKGLDSLIGDPNEGSGSNAVTEILGVSDSGQAVGFYVNSSNAQVAFQLDIQYQTYTDLAPPGAINAEATGINNRGNITGFQTSSSGTSGFYVQNGTFYQVAYPSAQMTEALSLNRQDQVVGEYQSTDGQIHGFILTYPANGGEKEVWQSVDEPNASGTTVITGINNHDAISGWYVDASGERHGFVATAKK